MTLNEVDRSAVSEVVLFFALMTYPDQLKKLFKKMRKTISGESDGYPFFRFFCQILFSHSALFNQILCASVAA